MVTTELLVVGTFEAVTVAVVEHKDGGGTKLAAVFDDGPLVRAVLDRCRRPCAS